LIPLKENYNWQSKDCKRVNILIVGAGPATLGLFCNALKTNRLKNLVMEDGGVAVLEMGQSFGGGSL
jgi:ribulose 1,5-bisphosphate synthetase/thiazole synthase